MRLLILAALLAPAAAMAQARNGNVYDGTAHQPSAGVQQTERAAGIAPPPQQERAETDEVEQTSRQLLGKTPHAGCIGDAARC